MHRLKELREEAMMTVRALSERSGVSEDTITKIENGHRKGRSMTLRKLAKALGVEPYQLSPEHFGRSAEREVISQHNLVDSKVARANPPANDAEYAYILEAAISQVYEVMHTIAQRTDESPSQRGYSDHVPRMNISERQQKVLITVLEYGEVGPSTVADRLEISVSTAYRDLSVLEEHGLVVTDESGRRVISPLGRDLVEAIVDTRNRLYYHEALNHVATLVEVYESVVGFDPHEAAGGQAAAFNLLQEMTIQSIRQIVATAKPPEVAQQTPIQKLREDLWANSAAIGLPMDPWDLAREVWTALNRYMTSPPSQQVIRADIESVPQTNVLEALDTTVAAYLTGRFETEAEGQERMYKNFLWLLKKPRHRRYPTQRGGTRNPQQASARYTDS